MSGLPIQTLPQLVVSYPQQAWSLRLDRARRIPHNFGLRPAYKLSVTDRLVVER
jgi:hypothetical protein